MEFIFYIQKRAVVINCILHAGKLLWIPSTIEITNDPSPQENNFFFASKCITLHLLSWVLQNAVPHVFLCAFCRGLPDHRATPPSLASVDLTYSLPGDAASNIFKFYFLGRKSWGPFFRGRIFCMSLALDPLRPWPVLLVIGLRTPQR